MGGYEPSSLLPSALSTPRLAICLSGAPRQTSAFIKVPLASESLELVADMLSRMVIPVHTPKDRWLPETCAHTAASRQSIVPRSLFGQLELPNPQFPNRRSGLSPLELATLPGVLKN